MLIRSFEFQHTLYLSYCFFLVCKQTRYPWKKIFRQWNFLDNWVLSIFVKTGSLYKKRLYLQYGYCNIIRVFFLYGVVTFHLWKLSRIPQKYGYCILCILIFPRPEVVRHPFTHFQDKSFFLECPFSIRVILSNELCRIVAVIFIPLFKHL